MKKIFKKSLMCILIIFLLMNFTSMTITNYSYATEEEGSFLDDIIFAAESIFTGLVGLITWIPRAIIMALLVGLNTLISGFARLGVGEIQAITGSIDVFVTPFHVFFNRIPILDVNFFDFEGVSGTVATFRTAVAGWYYTIRLIAAMILAVILLYIGIRMAISTIASEKALYKKMLVDWAISLALLFLLHYIMIFILSCNSAIVKALEDICTESDLTKFIGQLTAQAFGLETSSAIAAMILYGIIIYQTISFIFAYVKRMLTIGFLIMIAPLITITYSIDRIGDGKAQALNTWLKEFSYNILIQPFHCILFAAFASVAFDLIGLDAWTAGSSLAEMILAVACIQFIKTGEELVKKIFGFGQASISDMAAGMVATGAAIKYGGKFAAQAGGGVAKAKNFISNHKDQISSATKGLSNKVSKATSQLKTVNDQGELTKFGHMVAARKAEKQTQKDKNSNPRLNEENAYVNNYNNVEKQMQEKFKAKQDKAVQKAKEKKEKSDEKKAKAVEKRNQKKEAYDQKHGEGSYDAKQQHKSDVRREISGVTSNFMSKYGKQMASATAGVVTGLIGFGGGLDTAIAVGGIGSGFVKGYLSNTNQTIQKEISGDAQALANLNQDNPNFDIEQATYGIYATAQNGGFEKVEEKLDKILDSLRTLSPDGKDEEKLAGNQLTAIGNAIKTQLAKDPASLNMEFIENLSKEYNVTDSSGIRQYATLAAQSHYANTINTATSAGRSMEDIVNAAVNGISLSDVNVNVAYEGSNTGGTGDSDTTRGDADGVIVDRTELRDVKHSIDENNRKIDKFNSENDDPIQPGPK